MAKSVPVPCPTCGREHPFTPPTYPCACGAPLTLPVAPGAAPQLLGHRSWQESWVAVRCPGCGRQGQWPRPEFDCVCGAVLQLPVENPPSASAGTRPAARRATRSAFRPVAIRTERDAVTAAQRYLRWLGHAHVQRPAHRASGGGVVDLLAAGLVVRVDPTTLPTTVRDIECLWLYALTDDATGVCFSLAGYTTEARVRADGLGVPLFVMDLTGTPRALNDGAEEMVRGR
ncbi:hypothetical protein [Streptomyces caatingaensis]|uniref:Restriction endonuclease type IV Mrr domain-containing protein n=1 Tax=Streptomyces caatingaensis TaxID=1678637 RepID=A0A0K9XJ49_9ACTN|nr:hypothetical protein [Streptomyces caatingaensis]KNB53424.1 hypothetical protein AC230_01745 [Streptomyces caatingaensis]